MGSTAVRIDPSTLARLFATSGASTWNVTPAAFAEVIETSVAHRFPAPPSASDLDVYLASLHLGDLALATACRAGHDSAWEHFVREVRPSLYATARTIAGDDGRELADSLYADLFGLPNASGTSRSLLAYYHGRSRLVTWLRSVLVQKTIDRRRQTWRFTPLETDEDAVAPRAATTSAGDPDRDRLVGLAQVALDAAVDALDPKDRIRLRLYYGQDLTLARIGRLLGESEATVSRRLERARRSLRSAVEQMLRRQHGLTDAAVRQSFEYAAEAPELQLDRLLSRTQDG